MTTLERNVPYDLAAEAAVLGALLLNRDAIIHCAAWLEPGHFFGSSHGQIYGVIRDLYRRREPPDLVTVAARLADQGLLAQIGGMAELTRLVGAVPTAVHLEYYARIVQQHAIRRRLIQIGGRIAGLGYDTEAEPEALLSQATALIREVHAGSPEAWVHLAEVWQTNTDAIIARAGGAAGPGLPTGFDTLTAETDGWQPGDLIILAARTSRGKSAMALHFAQAAARAGAAVGIVSLEARKESLGLRLLARESGVDKSLLQTAQVSAHNWERIAGVLADPDRWAERLWFLDAPTQTVAAVEAFVEQLRAAPGRGCDLLIVDYLQLLRGTGSTREAEVSGISRALKLLGMRAGIPIIALAQLSRAALGAEVPSLHHLRESGALEQDASIVLLLHRPDDTRPGRMDLIIAKQREGVADRAIALAWEGGVQRFSELAAPAWAAY